jgi:hypothetical protein
LFVTLVNRFVAVRLYLLMKRSTTARLFERRAAAGRCTDSLPDCPCKL